MMHKDIARIRQELIALFPEIEPGFDESERTFYLYLDQSAQMVLKISKEYLENHTIKEIIKHLQVNIFYILKSNINKQVCLLKNFEIEVEDLALA